MSDGLDGTRGLIPSGVADPVRAVALALMPGGRKSLFRVGPGRYKVGAAAEADWVIQDEAVSRGHVELTLAREGVQVRDLGSRNGTWLLGQRIQEATVSLGSGIRIGQTEIRFDLDREDFEGTQGRPQQSYGSLVGASPVMQRLFTLLGRLEHSLCPVLIEGPSGSGKEVIARELHEHSAVKSGPYVALNCGALERSLVRTELFGHKKGAFTGAVADAVGAFEAASGGTLFLDEVGELPLDVQPMLLRVLETGQFMRLGESKPRTTKVRLIAATNRSLKDDVESGLFREDLYYRLKVVVLSAPSLAERPGDIPLLAQSLAARFGQAPLSPEVVAELGRREFRGNVRELAHAIQSYGVLGELPGDLRPRESSLSAALESFLDVSLPYAEQKEALVEAMTKIYLEKLVAATGGNRSLAARQSGLQRGYLRRLLYKYGLAVSPDEAEDSDE